MVALPCHLSQMEHGMNQNRILNTLRTPNAILVVLVLALVAQMPHAADVFRLIVHGSDWLAVLHSYSFAIALELAVLLFVVQNRHVESYGFAAVSVAMNISYYHLHDVHLWSLAALPAVLVSVALPIAIARYSHAVAEVPLPSDIKPKRKSSPVQTAEPAVHSQSAEDAQVEPDTQPNDAQIPVIDKKHRVQQMRAEGLTIAQIADEMGVHRNTVSNWLNGHSKAVHP